mmetsp:Transcript_41368/g.63056  ORF Transcript_41368/g.63056 Transcript_41368/m.63056 type:complete len:187 (+) Transcript_41368:183-743(+)
MLKGNFRYEPKKTQSKATAESASEGPSSDKKNYEEEVPSQASAHSEQVASGSESGKVDDADQPFDITEPLLPSPSTSKKNTKKKRSRKAKNRKAAAEEEEKKDGQYPPQWFGTPQGQMMMQNQSDPFFQQQVAQMSMLLQQQAAMMPMEQQQFMGGPQPYNPAMLQQMQDFFQNLNGQIMASQQQQ